jgi:Bifunctional DNA primase/polymerase, N-terminal
VPIDNGDPPFDFAELPEPEFNIEDIDMPEPGETNSFEDHVNGVEQPLPAPGAAMVEFALDYARRGWPMFPCRPANKAPFFEGGFHVATTCEETIRKW